MSALPIVLRTCPYEGCRLRCSSKQSHRARYAYISSQWKEKVLNLNEKMKEKKSKKINYEVLKDIGILWPIPDSSIESSETS